MHRNKLACSLLVLVVAGSMWACSDDDTDPTGTAGSGGASAGSSGKGGSGGKGGSAGKAQGGEDTGSAGEGGAEAGADAGAGGDSAGGAGGAGGDSSGAGAGGEGGAPPALTLAEACTAVCAAQSALACANDTTCTDECTGIFELTAVPDDYDAMIVCQAEKLTAINYACSDQGPNEIAAPKAMTDCEAAICKWTCADATFVDVNAYDRCGCT